MHLLFGGKHPLRLRAYFIRQHVQASSQQQNGLPYQALAD